jgi:hypothetical protein
MKNLRTILIAGSLLMLFSSCRLWNNMFGPKYGCKTNGKNVGAEKLVGGDAKSEKEAKKAKKFRS